MSEVSLYHYQKGKDEPKKHAIANASAWMAGLLQVIDISTEQSVGIKESEYTELYNRFQDSDAPEWQKIAAGFLSSHTLVLDDDRQIVSDALNQVPMYVQRGTLGQVVKQVGNKLMTLEKGPVVVTSSFGEGEFPYEQRIDINRFTNALQNHHEYPSRSEIENLLEEHVVEKPIPLETVLKTIERAVTVPRYWK